MPTAEEPVLEKAKETASLKLRANVITPADLGKGYDSLAGTVKIPILKVPSPAVSGGKNSFDFFVEFDYKEIRDKLESKSTVDIKTMTTTVDFSLDITKELHSKEMSVYAFHRLKVTTAQESIPVGGFTVMPDIAAFKTGTETEIYGNMGNKVITGITKGGEMIVVATFTSRSVEESTAIKAKLNGKTSIFSSSVDFNSTLDALHSEIGQHVTCSIKAHWVGGKVNRPNLLENPATAIDAITEWQATLATHPVVTGISTEDLIIADKVFREVSIKANRYQDKAHRLDRQYDDMTDTIGMVNQYLDIRKGMQLPVNPAAVATRQNAESLLVKIAHEKMKLVSNAMGTFTPSLDEEISACRKKTPLFSFSNMGKNEWGGFGTSGMEPFDMDPNQVKYLTYLEIFEVGAMNGIFVKYKDFMDKEQAKWIANTSGTQHSFSLSGEVITQMQYGGQQRDRWMSVGYVGFFTSEGKHLGPWPKHEGPAENTWGDALTVGSERYLVGFWGSGGNWLQKIGPYFRQCKTNYPYA